MGHCCSGDKDVLFGYDAEGGAPLSAYFQNIFDIIIQNGSGVGGSKSASSNSYTSVGGFFAEMGYLLSAQTDQCGNPRHEFAIGAMFNGKNNNASWVDTGAPFFALGVGDKNDTDFSTFANLFGLSRYGRGFKLILNGGVEASGDQLFTITNVFDYNTFPLRFIEIIGSVSSENPENSFGLGVPGNDDAWVELHIDGVPMVDGDDFELAKAAWLKGEKRRCVTPRKTGLATLNVGGPGWNLVQIAPMGDLDCFYIKERATYCNQDVDPIRPNDGVGECLPPGPGGSTYDGCARGPRQ